MYPSRSGALPPEQDSTGSPPNRQHGCREELFPALSEPEYVWSDQRARKRQIIHAARFHTGRSDRPVGTGPRPASSTSYSSPNSRSSRGQTDKPIPNNIEDNPTEVTDNIAKDETSNVNSNPFTVRHNNKVVDEVADDAENNTASVDIKDVVEPDEVEVSLVCKCHPCGNFCDLNEYKSTHLSDCVPPVVKFVKVTCICGRTFRVEKHLFITNNLCRHTHFNNDRTVQEDDDVNSTIETFNGLSIDDCEDPCQHLNYTAVNSNINGEDDNLGTDNSEFNEDEPENEDALRNDTPEGNINEQSDEESSKEEHTYLMSPKGSEDELHDHSNCDEDPEHREFEDGNSDNQDERQDDDKELHDKAEECALQNNGSSQITVCTKGFFLQQKPTFVPYQLFDLFKEHYYNRNEYKLVVASLKEKFRNNVESSQDESDDFNDGNNDHENERQDNNKASQNNDSLHINEHHQSNGAAANLNETFENNDEVIPQDESVYNNMDNENRRQDNDNAEPHDEVRDLASVNNESPQRTENHQSNGGVANLNETFENNDEVIPEDESVDNNIDNENRRQDNDNAEPYDEVKDLASVNNESSQITEHHQSNGRATNLNETFENHDEVIPQDESVDNNIDNENRRQDNDNAELRDEVKDLASVNNESPQITEHHQSNGGVANLNEIFENNDDVIPQDESVDNNIDNENGRQDNCNAEPHDEVKDLASVNNESSQITENDNTICNAAREILRNVDAVAPLIDRNINDENEGQDDEIQSAEFNEMCIMYRFDFLNRCWISRGPGRLLILFDPENGRWLLQFRRTMAPGEFRVTWIMPIHPGLRLQEMKYNNRAWEWTYHYLTKDGEGKFDNLGVRFQENETARAFYEKFNSVKEIVIDTTSYARRYRFATSCPTWPPAREVSTPSDVTSICGAVSPTFNASLSALDDLPPTDGSISPNDGAVSPTDGAVSPTDGAVSPTPTDGMSNIYYTTEHISVRTDPNDGVLARGPEVNFDINIPSTSGTSQTLITVNNNEEIVHELKEIKNKQNETLVEVKKMASLIQSYGKNSEENGAIGTATTSGNCEDINKEKAQEKKNNGNCGASNEGNENDHISAKNSGKTSECTGVLKPRTKISNESIQKNNESHDDAKIQAKKGTGKGKDNKNKSLSKTKNKKTIEPISTEPAEQLNMPPAVTDLSYPADEEMNSDDSNSKKSKVPTQETPNSATNEIDAMSKPSTSKILSQPDILTQSNTAKPMKKDVSCNKKRANNKDTEKHQPLQTTEIIDETKNKCTNTTKETTKTTTVTAPKGKKPAEATTTTNNDTNIEDQAEEDDKNKDPAASCATVEPETSSSFAAKENGPEVAEDKEDNSLTKEKSKHTKLDTVIKMETNTTNTNKMNLRPLQIIIKIMRVCCRIVFYMLGLGIITLVTILLIYFFEDIMFTFECLEREND